MQDVDSTDSWFQSVPTLKPESHSTIMGNWKSQLRSPNPMCQYTKLPHECNPFADDSTDFLPFVTPHAGDEDVPSYANVQAEASAFKADYFVYSAP